MTNWTNDPVVTPLSEALQHVAPWAWLSHQWWFIAAVLLIGLAFVEVADREARR